MAALLPQLELVFQDETGSTGALYVNLTAGTTVSEADSVLGGFAAALQRLTGTVLVRTRLIYRLRNTTPVAAAPGSTIKRNGVFLIDTSSDAPGAIVALPAILDDYLIFPPPGCTTMVDLSNSNVIAFIDALIGAGVCNPFGDTATTVFAAYLASRV